MTPHPTTSPPAAASLAPRRCAKASELALVIVFLGILFAVPVTQTCLELAGQQRVQFTDVFRARPTASRLRQYEQTLEEKSWFQRQLRPWAQRLLFASVRDTGAQAVLGRDEWLFYRPDLRYLVEPNRTETDRGAAKWARPSEGLTERESVVRAIVRFRDQLRERGIELLVVPMPGKPSVYPDQVTGRGADRMAAMNSPTVELLATLGRAGVATADLFSAFADARGGPTPLYLARDTHWTPRGVAVAAQTIAAALRQRGWAPLPTKQFQTQPVLVNRWGDILEMTRVPGIHARFAPEPVSCEQVRDPALGLLLPTPSDRPGAYRHPARNAQVLVLGDSFCRIYQFPEPQSLGELPANSAARGGDGRAETRGTKRLLPGSAGLISHLARELGTPVDAIVSDGGASTDVRRKLSTNPEMLEGKQVVIWEFVERDIRLGRAAWQETPLPPRLGQ